MSEKCFVSKCQREVSSLCKCKNTETYCCKEHLSDHISSPDQHAITPILITISNSKGSESLKKILKLLSELKKMQKLVHENAKKIINSTIFLSNKSLHQLESLQSQLHKFLQNIIQGKMVNKGIFETIDSSFSTNFESFPNLNQNLTSFFEISQCQKYSEKFECSEVIFSKGNLGGLCSIDLETMKLSKLNYAPSIRESGQVCRINEEDYFFYGGYDDDGAVGDVFVVNFVKKVYQTLVSQSDLYQAASAFQNGKVYIFGGDNGTQILKTCKTVDLATKTWNSIPDLPQRSSCNLAEVLDSEIIVTGHDLNKLYAFNKEVYSEVFDLPANTYKIVSDGWVVIPQTLFEYKFNEKIWRRHDINWNNCCLWAYTTFKRKQFIYFIELNNELWRIDTSTKKLEKVPYS